MGARVCPNCSGGWRHGFQGLVRCLPRLVNLAFNVGLGDILWGILTWHVEWYDINYDPATWKFDDLKINMTKNEIYDKPFVSF